MLTGISCLRRLAVEHFLSAGNELEVVNAIMSAASGYFDFNGASPSRYTASLKVKMDTILVRCNQPARLCINL